MSFALILSGLYCGLQLTLFSTTTASCYCLICSRAFWYKYTPVTYIVIDNNCFLLLCPLLLSFLVYIADCNLPSFRQTPLLFLSHLLFCFPVYIHACNLSCYRQQQLLVVVSIPVPLVRGYTLHIAASCDAFDNNWILLLSQYLSHLLEVTPYTSLLLAMLSTTTESCCCLNTCPTC